VGPPDERFVGDQPDLLRADLHRPKLLGAGLVHDDRIDQAEVAEPFATLADPEPPRELDGSAPRETGASSGGGSNEALLIGAAGFEPAASRTQAECATRLRYAPLSGECNHVSCRQSIHA
jgi:hypothetical protein